MSKTNYDIVASIDVGSNALRMLISQIRPDAPAITLDDLWKPASLGSDTFTYGKVTANTIRQTCEDLKGFASLMKDYKIKIYKAISTSGIREAENKDYVLEQIRLKTGLEVQSITNSQERFFMYKAIRDYMNDIHKLNNEGTLILDIGSGGVEITVYKKGTLALTDYIKVGSLRLRKVLADLEQLTLDFPSIMEEFVESKIYMISTIIHNMNIKNFIGLGGELRIICELCRRSSLHMQNGFLEKDTLEKLYYMVRKLTIDQIINEYNLPRNQAEILLPSVIIFRRFLEMTKAPGIHIPLVSLRHGLTLDIIDELYNPESKRFFIDEIINTVRYTGQKYNIEKVHSYFVEKTALLIFDKTMKLHGMKQKERFYLQIASILHDIGKYVNHNLHDQLAYNIIMAQGIMGLTQSELSMVANTAKYHSEDIPTCDDSDYASMPQKDRITVSKLSAILKLAESLDISHKQKAENIRISFSGSNLMFKINANDDMLLEEWNFMNNSEFFEDVMGIKPVMKIIR